MPPLLPIPRTTTPSHTRTYMLYHSLYKGCTTTVGIQYSSLRTARVFNFLPLSISIPHHGHGLQKLPPPALQKPPPPPPPSLVTLCFLPLHTRLFPLPKGCWNGRKRRERQDFWWKILPTRRGSLSCGLLVAPAIVLAPVYGLYYYTTTNPTKFKPPHNNPPT